MDLFVFVFVEFVPRVIIMAPQECCDIDVCADNTPHLFSVQLSINLIVSLAFLRSISCNKLKLKGTYRAFCHFQLFLYCYDVECLC